MTQRRIVRLEEAGRRFGAELGLKLELGAIARPTIRRTRSPPAWPTDCSKPCSGGSPHAGGADLLRLDPLSYRGAIADVSFSGGVSEYIYGGEAKAFGDLGPQLAAELRARLAASGAATGAARRAHPRHRDRRLAIHHAGVRQTIFVSPLDTLPLRNVPVIAPDLPLDDETSIPPRSSAAIKSALKRLDLGDGDKPGRGVRAVARLGDVPPARRFLQRRRRRACRPCSRTAIPSCLPATATSAA